MECQECARLEQLRYDCIVHYVELMQAQRRIESESGTPSPALNDASPTAEAQLNQAWEDLAAPNARES